MKRDCPHCHASMEGDFLQWRKFAKQDHSRACPVCGKAIQMATYPEETGVRLLAAAALVGGCYLAKERGGGYLVILVAVIVVIATAFALVHFRLRDRQRFRKAAS
ncbi:MAG TPA: hypothetical protein VM073_07860 [Usitatibacter sp.]|nr:hypothetical protein [Usitatibacter sp.]